MKNLKSILILAGYLCITLLLQSCTQSSQDDGTSITVRLPSDITSQLGGSSSVINSISGKPSFVNRIIISAETASGNLIGSGDILQSGNSITFTVPPFTPLLIKGVGYADSLIVFQGETNVPALNPGEQSGVSLTLNEVNIITGDVNGTVRDAVSNALLAGVLVTVMDANNAPVISTTTDSSGAYTLTVPSNQTLTLTLASSTYITANYSNVVATTNQTTTLDVVLLIDIVNGGSNGTVSGQITNSATSAALSGVNITLRANINSQTGTPIGQPITTDGNGNYLIPNLTAGYYTAELSLAGFITTYSSVAVLNGVVTAIPNASLSPATVSGSISGTVRDAASNLALAGVNVIAFNPANVSSNSTVSDSNGAYTLIVPANQTYTVTLNSEGYLTATYSNVQVMANETNILEVVLQINTDNTGTTGGASGQIVDSTTGTAVSGVTITLRAGINTQAGTIIGQPVLSDANGNFLIDNLAAGNYTAELSLTRFITSYRSILVLGGQTIANQNASLSPIPIISGATRIVLTWGTAPRDLDSHLTGPTADGATTRFHIYYASKGSDTVAPFSVLDVDDVSSFGPETVTIATQFQGIYRYSVLDFTNQSNAANTALAESSAKVEVFRGSTLVRVFNVPAGAGTLWTVFELNGDTITAIDTLSSGASSGTISSVTNVNQYDADLMVNLPAK